MNTTYERGGDAKAIARIAEEHFGGSYKTMFEAHGWEVKDGRQCMLQAGSRIKDRYDSVAKFEAHFDSKAKTPRPLQQDDRK